MDEHPEITPVAVKSELPSELQEHIINHLWDDPRTLLTCALVNHIWLHASRIHLADIRLHIALRKSCKYLLKLLRRPAAEKTGFATYIRNLRIHTHPISSIRFWKASWVQEQLPETISKLGELRQLQLPSMHIHNVPTSFLRCLLTSFPKIRSINIQHIHCDSPYQIIRALRAFPLLDSFELDVITVTADAFAHGPQEEFRFPDLPAIGDSTICLRKLYLRSIGNRHEELVGALLDSTKVELKLHTLRLGMIIGKKSRPTTEMVQVNGDTLEHLCIIAKCRDATSPVFKHSSTRFPQLRSLGLIVEYIQQSVQHGWMADFMAHIHSPYLERIMITIHAKHAAAEELLDWDRICAVLTEVRARAPRLEITFKLQVPESEPPPPERVAAISDVMEIHAARLRASGVPTTVAVDIKWWM